MAVAALSLACVCDGRQATLHRLHISQQQRHREVKNIIPGSAKCAPATPAPARAVPLPCLCLCLHIGVSVIQTAGI